MELIGGIAPFPDGSRTYFTVQMTERISVSPAALAVFVRLAQYTLTRKWWRQLAEIYCEAGFATEFLAWAKNPALKMDITLEQPDTLFRLPLMTSYLDGVFSLRFSVLAVDETHARGIGQLVSIFGLACWAYLHEMTLRALQGQPEASNSKRFRRLLRQMEKQYPGSKARAA